MKTRSVMKGLSLSAATLTLCQLLALPSTVRADNDDVIDTTRQASLTIHKYDETAAKQAGVDLSQFSARGETDDQAATALANYAIKDVQFSYLKVGNIHVKSDNGKMGVLYDLPKELATILKVKSQRADGYFTSTELNAALATALADNTATKNKLENYLKADQQKTAMTLTDETGTTKSTGLSQGLYLVIETQVPANVHTTTDPFFVSLPMTDVTGDRWFYDVDVYPKNQTSLPTLDKKVRQVDDGKTAQYADTATASSGDVLDYLLVSKLPKITSEATYLSQYQFTDRLAQGLSYQKEVTIAFYDSKEDAEQNKLEKALTTWDAQSGKFTVTYGNQDKSMVITPTQEGLSEIDTSLSEKYMVVSYQAQLLGDTNLVLGDKGNDNQARLDWKRTSETNADSLQDQALVYSFGIDLTKEFTAKNDGKKGDASKVQFVLQNKTDGHYLTAKAAGAGQYYVSDNQKGTKEGEATPLSPSADGRLMVYGLEADDYVLTEIKTDDGYQLLKSPMTISFTQTQDSITPSQSTLYDTESQAQGILTVAGDRAKATVDQKEAEMTAVNGSEHGAVVMTVTNTPGFTLPMTGSKGMIVCTIAGAVIASGGAYLLLKSKKKASGLTDKRDKQ